MRSSASNTSEVRVNILREGAGDINESDINLASASDAVVIGFNTKLDAGAQRSAEATGVDVRIYDVIYKLTDDLGQALSGLLTPKLVEQVEGHAEVRMVIKAGRAGNIAGSYVTDGRIVRGGQARLIRGGEVIADTRITSLKRFKDDVREVADGLRVRDRPRRRGHRRGRRHRVLPDGGRAGLGTDEPADRSARQPDPAELMQLLQREMKDPRIGFATVTRVETARDLGSAKVWVSVLGTPDEQQAALKALTDAAPWLRRQLGGRLTTSPRPAARHPPRRLDRGGGPGAATPQRDRGGEGPT